jgi:hypothetical protein
MTTPLAAGPLVPPPPPGPTVPPPPPGPGVQPPFAAPPTDGTRQRRWLAVGLAGGLALLICVGGLVGLGAIVVLGTQVVRDDATRAVENYLTAVKDRDFDKAYDQLCEATQAKTTRAQYARAQSRRPGISSFTVGTVDLADAIMVPATIRYVDQTVVTVHYLMEQDSRTGGIEVCTEED